MVFSYFIGIELQLWNEEKNLHIQRTYNFPFIHLCYNMSIYHRCFGILHHPLKQVDRISQKIGANLENIIFLELKRRSKEIYYYKTEKGREVDFLIQKENFTELIQVSVTLENEETYHRELRVFAEANRELRGEVRAMLITLDSSEVIECDGCEVEIINVLEFLLGVD